MQYILTTGWEDGIADLTERLISELASGKKVLWLLSGGSNVEGSIQIMDNISETMSRGLSISLVDERYGKVGHADSNWAQLARAGLEPKRAQLLPVLKEGLSFSQTAERYESLMQTAFGEADVIIAQLGIGPDGHIAGVLPNSRATGKGNDLVIGYDSPPFQRITLTLSALLRVTAAYAFAFGDTKQEALTSLQSKKLSPRIQPAQILKKLPEAYIYSDQIGSVV